MACNPNLQASVVQTLDSAIHRINYYQADKCYKNQYCAIQWIEIYPVDSVIDLLNSGLVNCYSYMSTLLD